MDSPLNSAHFQERRAEAFISCHQFSEAIHCHQKAAEYLLEAMKLTHVAQALISLQLQYEDHVRQEKVLKDKWKRYEIQQEQLKLETENKLKEKQRQLSNVSPQTNQSNATEAEIKKKKEKGLITSTCSLVISAENFSVSSLNSSTEFFPSKEPKELSTESNSQVRELQIQILSLTQALEDSNRENTKLKRTIALMKDVAKKRFMFDFDEEMLPMTDDVLVPNILGSECVLDEETNVANNDQVILPTEEVDNEKSEQVDLCISNEGDNVNVDNSSDEGGIPLPPLEVPDFPFEGNT